jgi:hypothetical protein
MIQTAITSAMVVRCFKKFWCNAQMSGELAETETPPSGSFLARESGDF